MDYKEKIRKLLALAESPNEHEAKLALLKARKLMAEHKLAETELKDCNKQKVKNVLTDVTFSKRKNHWILYLSAIIGENYCCQSYRSHGYREQTQRVGFVGFEDDIEICIAIFKYAVDCILSGCNRIKQENDCYNSGHVKKLCDSYGYGFALGVSDAFQEQQTENDWGLVLVVPREVKEATQDFKKRDFESKAQENISDIEYMKGYSDGKDFDPKKRLPDDPQQCGQCEGKE